MYIGKKTQLAIRGLSGLLAGGGVFGTLYSWAKSEADAFLARYQSIEPIIEKIPRKRDFFGNSPQEALDKLLYTSDVIDKNKDAFTKAGLSVDTTEMNAAIHKINESFMSTSYNQKDWISYFYGNPEAASRGIDSFWNIPGERVYTLFDWVMRNYNENTNIIKIYMFPLIIGLVAGVVSLALAYYLTRNPVTFGRRLGKKGAMDLYSKKAERLEGLFGQEQL